MKNVLMALLIPVFLMTACASGPTIVGNVNPGTDFRVFETYGFIQPLGTDRSSGARTPLSTRLMDSMSREMTARGLSRSENPDLLIDFIVATEERVDVRQTPTNTVHRSHWGTGFSTWPTYQTTVRQYTEGTFLVDLIDVNNAMLIGEAAASGRMRQELRDFDQDQVNQVMSDIMNQLLPAL